MKNIMLRNLGLTFVAASFGTAVVAGPALAEYPDRPITMMIGYKAGGGTDTVGRVLAKVMGEDLGQQINIVNKAGAGGGIATIKLKKAKPDGYTILLNPSTSLTLNPYLVKKLTYKIDDYTYAGMLTAYQAALVAPIDRPYNNLKEFLAFAKKNPGTKYAALNSTARMVMNVITKDSGLDISIVPVKGGAGMLAVVFGGQVDLAYSGGIHQQHPTKIKLIAAGTSSRQPLGPNIPTLREDGYDMSFDSFTTLIVPKKTPKAIVAKLEAALAKAAKNPAIIALSARVSFPMAHRNGADATAEMHRQWRDYGKLIKATGTTAK